MNILLTNDDGYGSKGLMALVSRLSLEHKVFVIAPDGNRSGKGMATHIAKPLYYHKMGERSYTCSGTPVDCVIAGIKTNLLGEKIDLVVSGINQGSNVGTEIVYSGTCSAATQATFFGIPAIAASLNITYGKDWDDENSWDYEPLADFVANNLESLKSLARPSVDSNGNVDKPGVFVNVNVYDYPKFKGVKQTDCCFIRYDGKTEVKLDSGNEGDFKSIFWGLKDSVYRTENSDYEAAKDGYISLERIIVDPVSEPADISGITWKL